MSRADSPISSAPAFKKQSVTSDCIHDLSGSLSDTLSQTSRSSQGRSPIIVTFFAASGDEEKLRDIGLNFCDVFWKSFDIQPMAKKLRPKGKVAGKGPSGHYKLVEAAEEYGIRMTSQKELQERHTDRADRADKDPVQHCAVDDAANTLKLTVHLVKDCAEVYLTVSIEEVRQPKTFWPPRGGNIRLLSIDTETCVLPEHLTLPSGQKYPKFMSEIGGAFVDTDTIREHPENWQEHITTFHAIIAEHWDHHPHVRCQAGMGISHDQAFYPRYNASSGPSGCARELRTFLVNGKEHSAVMSPDSEIVPRADCLGWILDKIFHAGHSE